MFSTYIFKESFSSISVFVQKIISAFLLLLIVFFGNLQVSGQTTVQFTDANWLPWVNGSAGNALTAGRGVQVTTGKTNAYVNSNVSYSNVSSVEVTYSTNASAGAGTINIFSVSGTSATRESGTRIGNSTNVTTTGGTSDRIMTFTPTNNTPFSGHIQIHVTCTTNSIYIKSVKINYAPSCTAPTYQTSGLNISNETTSGGDVVWTNAPGSDGTIVFMAPDGSPPFTPTDGTSYTANSDYSAGTDLGSGWKCVYKGSVTSVNVTGLLANSPYQLYAYSYNDCSGSNKFNTTNAPSDYLITQAAASSYNVIFNGNGSTSGSMSNQSITANGTATLTANTFARTGYTFTGWNTAADGSGTAYANQANFTIGLANVTLYAQWICVPPAAPLGQLTINPSCGSVTLVNNQLVPAGVTFYWQSITNGTSTSEDASSVNKTVTSTGTVYLNSYNPSTSCWSTTATSVFVLVRHPIVINTNLPATRSVQDGNTTVFTVNATNGNTFEWQLSTDGGATWNTISGATSSSYTTPTLTWANNGNKYRVKINTDHPCPSVYSVETTIQITCASSIAMPSGGSFSTTQNCGNTDVSYSNANASGYTLYWQTSASGTSTVEPASVSKNFTSNGTTYVRGVDVNGCWTTASQTSVSITNAVTITTQPTSQNATVGNGATFTVSASNAGGYQWQEEIGGVWTNMSGQTSSTLTLSGLTLADNGKQYRVEITGNAPCGVIYSNVVTLSVSTGPCYASHANNANSTSGSINTGDTDLGNSTKRLASTSNPGSLIFNTTGVNVGNIILKFRVKGWSSSETQMTINLNGTPVTVTDLPTSFDWYTINLTTTVANPVLILSTIQNKRVHIGNVEIYCPPTCTPATISTNPASASISPGNNVILNFAGAGYTTAQWQTSTNGTTWTDLIGEINTSYSTPNLNTTTYYRVVLDAGTPCEVISSTATITVSSITVNPISNQTSVYGDAINTTLTTVNYTSPTTVAYVATLPAGLSINASTGLITGTLTQSVASSPFAASITVTPIAGSPVTVSFTWTITPKTLIISGAVADNKPYDGNTIATITGALVGVISPDVVIMTGDGIFASANAGTGIGVTSNLTLGGVDAGNYTLTHPTGLSANIFKVIPTLTPGSINVNVGGIVTISSNSSGVITLTNVPSIVSTSGSNITGVTAGSGTIDVNITEGLNHTAATINISVTVVTFANGTYRTTSSGTWPSGTATWERLQSGSWVVATPTESTSDLLIIRDSIASRAAFSTTNGTLMLIENGGVFNGLHNSTFQNLTVKNGGKFYVSNPGVTITISTGQLVVEDGGTLILNSATLDNGDGLWKGVENFYPNSILEIKNWDWDNNTSNVNRLVGGGNLLSQNSHGYYFGNIEYNANSNDETFIFINHFNASINYQPSGIYKLCNNLLIKNQSISKSVIFANGSNANVEIAGNLRIEQGKFSFSSLTTSHLNHTVLGDIIIDGGIIDLNQNNSSSASTNVYLEGNLDVINGTLTSTDPDCKLIFSGNTPQTISIAGNLGGNVEFEVENLANVLLINQNLNLANSSNKFTVKNGGILNFNHFDILGNGSFDLQTNGKIIITSPDGIMTSGATGNVQTGIRTFDSEAIYHYVGQVNQTSGTALPIALANKKIIVELINNNTTFIVNTSGAVEVGTSGELEIRKGIVIDAGGASGRAIQGTGQLIMSDGIFRFTDNIGSSSSTTYYPRLSGNYTLNGGTVELASSQTGSQYQRLRGSRTYHNILISGSSTGGAYKDVSSAIVVNNNFSIVGSPIFDAGSNGITGDAGLTMTGGLYRTSRLTNSQPELAGISTPYTLTGGTIEFYGSSNSSSQNIRNKYGANVDIYYHNIEINSLSSNYNYTSGNVSSSSIVVDGTMNVNAPAVYRLANGFNVSGLGTFNLNSGATLFFGSVGGISTLNNTGAIRTSNKIFSPESSFGFISTGNQSSGNAFPSSIRNLHVLNNADVTFNSSLEVKDSLIMNGSNLDLGINTLTLGNSQVRKGELYRTSGFVIGKMERWFGNVNSGTVSGLFPIAVMESGNLRNRFVQVDYTTAATTGGKLLVEFMSTPMGFSGLPISASNSGGAGFDILTTEDQGYWRIDPASGGLSDGVYTISLTGEGYSTITNLTELTLLKRVNGGNWTAPGTHIAATGSIGVPTVTRSGVTGWSNFGFGGGFNNPLPVELTSLSIVCDNNSKNIVWSTATEYNASHFDVEYSYDMTEWKYLGSVQAKGNSITTTNYSLLDLENRNQIVYYRLNQYDFDGESTVYGPISELCQEGLFDLSIYPNPNNGVFTLQVVSQEVKENVELSIISLDGRLTKSKSLDLLSGVNTFPFSMVDLSTGIYIVKLKVDNEFSSYIKFTVK